jgi:nucleoside-triphosphatase THEP1
MPRPARLVTGPTHSGKTGQLMAWAEGRPEVVGIAAPDGPTGRRMIDLRSGDHVEMEHPAAHEPAVEIGPYRFRQAAFDWAQPRLLHAADDPLARYLVIDEIGPLELRGDALAPVLDVLLARPHLPELVVVVRDSLRDTVAARFDLSWEAFPPA